MKKEEMKKLAKVVDCDNSLECGNSCHLAKILLLIILIVFIVIIGYWRFF